jgi:hypothetical protein
LKAGAGHNLHPDGVRFGMIICFATFGIMLIASYYSYDGHEMLQVKSEKSRLTVVGMQPQIKWISARKVG